MGPSFLTVWLREFSKRLAGLLFLVLLLYAGGCRSENRAPTLLSGVLKDGAAQAAVPARVIEVIDGDTLLVRFEPGPGVRRHGSGWLVRVPGGWLTVATVEKVRLIGVNAPEIELRRKEPYGPEAKAYVRQRVLNRAVTLKFDVATRDQYGRLLAYVYLNGLFFNQELVKDGYAQVFTVPPNVKYADRLLHAQREAMRAGRGLWRKHGFAPGSFIGNSRTFTYHRPDCPGLPSPAHRVYFASEKEALWAGYHPCKQCCQRLGVERQEVSGEGVSP